MLFSSKTRKPAETSFDLLPRGWMHFEISELEPGENQNGRYVTATFECLEAEHAGRKVWKVFCLDHSKEQVREIAFDQVATLCTILEVDIEAETFEDLVPELNKLMNQPIRCKVAIKKSDEYDDKNEIKAFRSAEDPGKPKAAAKKSKGGWR